MGGDVGKVVKTAVIGAAIATGIGLVLTPTLVAGATFAGMSGTLAYFAGSFAVNAALGAVGSALASKPESNTSLAELQGRTVMTKQPIVSRKIVYGEVKTSGAIVFMEATNDNQDLHVAVTLAGHEISAVKDVFFNSDKVRDADLSDGVEVSADSGTTPDYSSNASITAHFGTSSQAADTNLVSRTSFTTNHRLRGIAYLYAFLQYDQDVFANGLPNISAVIQGKKVFDPRTDTTGYSSNAALCIRDYLTDTTYGLGATTSEIDDDSFIAAANICDEDVTLLAGGTEKRYTMNGVVDTSKSPRAILEDMLTSCNGSIYYSNGKWKIKVGAYVTPSQTITVDELRGAIKLQTRNSGQDQFNAVKGVFVAPENNWQPTDFPEFTSSTFETEDGGERKYVDLRLPFTTSVSTAQRLAKQMCYRNREQLLLTAPCNLKAFEYEVGDTVYVTNERLGFDQKPFEIISWTLATEANEDGYIFGVDLVLKETSSAIYAWNEAVDESEFTFNNTTLPNAFNIQAPGISISDDLRSLNQEAISVLIVDVSQAETFTTSFEVQARKSGDADYINLGQASGNRFELLNVEDNAVYEVRARAINSFGVRSQFTNGSHQVVGKTAPPSDVTNFSGNLVGNQLLLTWTPTPDLDLSHYRLRYSSELSGATYQNATSLIPRLARPASSAFVPARNGTYFIKAVDKLGLLSQNAATIVVQSNINDIENLNVVETLQEDPDWGGTFDDTLVVQGTDSLILDSDTLFDSLSGNFDDQEGLFDSVGDVLPEGFYYFSDGVDLGAVYTSRIKNSIESTIRDYLSLFDEAGGLFDAREGLFDGDPDAFDTVDVEVQYRATDDDPTGTPTWSEWERFFVTDVRARAFEFRAKLISEDVNLSPQVNALSVEVDMPDRVESGDDIVTSAGATAITFNTPFKVVPSIGIGAQDMQQGDYYVLSSKTRSGFTITFYDSGDNAVIRTFDYVAKGYGKEVNV